MTFSPTASTTSAQQTAVAIYITPEHAANLLAKSRGNRPISARVVETYARDMRSAQWKLTGDTIKVAVDGTLFDGHHRLKACVKANVPLLSYVVFGVEPDAIMAMDIGKTRTAGDYMHFAGEKQSVLLAASVRAFHLFATGDMRATLSTPQIARILEKHPGLRDSVTEYSSIPIRPKHAFIAVHYIGTRIQFQPEKAASYMSVIQSGIPSRTGCPAHMVRERMIRKDGATSTRWAAHKLVATSWVHFLNGTSPTFLRTPDTVTLPGLDADVVWNGVPAVALAA